MLFIIGGVTLVMLISVVGMVMVKNSSAVKQNTAGIVGGNGLQSQSPGQTVPGTTIIPVNSAAEADVPFTTKFINFIGGIFNPQKKTVTTANQTINTGGKGYGAGTLVKTQTTPLPQISSSGSNGKSGSSGGNNGGGNGNPSASSGQANTPTTPPGQPTPTPVTDINIVFDNGTGGYSTYVPPVVPPINSPWMRYINNQDHYAIDYL